MSLKVALIDYKMSNLFSIQNALNRLGIGCVITADRPEILSADGAILPGVGSFPEAMRYMSDLGLDETVKEFIALKKPFMGICLGFQLLFDASDEFLHTSGLGIIPGNVKTFSKKKGFVRVPHVGWNAIKKLKMADDSAIQPLRTTRDGECFYFVHSCYVEPAQSKGYVCTTTEYAGIEFCSSVLCDNVFACQFHPEKSGLAGLKILKLMFGH